MTEMDFCLPTRDPVRGFRMSKMPEEEIETHWKSIEQMMRALPRTIPDWTPESLYKRALCGEVQIWGVGDESKVLMVLLTQIAIFPAGKVLEVFWCAGQGVYEEAQELVDTTFDLFAKKENCRRIDIIGRDGWEKVLRSRGFKRTAVVWSRPVIHEGMQ